MEPGGERACLQLPLAKKGPDRVLGGHLSIRLRQLADDCEERARKTASGHARNLYHVAAHDARMGADARHYGEDQRRALLAAMEAQAEVARWYDGDRGETAPVVSQSVRQSAIEAQKTTALRASLTDDGSVVPPDALNARQLADDFSMNERRARRLLDRATRKGWPGFYRDGCKLFADRDAFARLSELCPNGSRVARHSNDEGHHTPPAAEARPEADRRAA